MERELVRVNVRESRHIFGSLISDKSYNDDALIDVRAWIDGLLAEVPEEYRGEVRMSIDTEGGYEGESYVAVEVYYLRPEIDDEVRKREHREWLERARKEDTEREVYERLKAKFGE